LRESQDIAIKVLERLDMMDWTQRKFAEKLEVSPQQVNKIVKGKENLTLETIVKIQEVLNISILLTHQERKIEARLDNFLKEVNTPVYQLNPKKKLVEVKVKTMEVIIQDSDIYNDGEKTQKYA
jgi:transcriptional regulator with XRE-family HTH domain